MPIDSLLVTIGVVAMFVVFAAALFSGDRQTQSKDWLTCPRPNTAVSDRAAPGGVTIRRTGAANPLLL